MNEFLIFCKSHWNLILICFLSIVQLVIFFLSKKKTIKVIDAISTILYKNIPDFIRTAESYYGAGHGEEKLEFVISCCKKIYESINLDFNYSNEKLVKEIVEEILSTPQKK